MSNHITKNQHIVPQFYLRNFSNDNKTIIEYDLCANMAKHQPLIKDVCCKKNMYEYKNNDGCIVARNTVENTLHHLEDGFSETVRNIEKKAFITSNERTSCFLTTSEKAHLILFVCVQVFRSKKVIDAVVGAFNNPQDMPDDTASFLKNLTAYEKRNLAIDCCLPFAHPTQNDAWGMFLNSLSGMCFQIVSTPNDVFYTTDNPVVLHSDNFNKTLSSVDEVIMPLTPRICFRLIKNDGSTCKNSLFCHKSCDDEVIVYLRDEILASAQRFLYTAREMSKKEKMRVLKIFYKTHSKN